MFCCITRIKGLKQYPFCAYDLFIPEKGFLKKHSVSFSAGAIYQLLSPLILPWYNGSMGSDIVGNSIK
jgi:hypothetical protein